MSEFLRPADGILKHGCVLPHWAQGEAIQFVTFRLADAMPVSKTRLWKEERSTWIAMNPEPWTPAQESEYHRRFTWRLERWLDQGIGSCVFGDPSKREILAECFMRFQGERVDHYAWVIMPNHVHLLFSPGDKLETLIKAWKGTSAKKIGNGSIWQKNYRDTIIRDREHFSNAVRYIRNNPLRLPEGTYTLWESERAREVK